MTNRKGKRYHIHTNICAQVVFNFYLVEKGESLDNFLRKNNKLKKITREGKDV